MPIESDHRIQKLDSNDFSAPCSTQIEPFSNGIFYREDPLNHYVPLVLFQIIVAVFVSRFLHFILRPFKQPRQLCDMIGAIILGPTAPYAYSLVLLLFHKMGLTEAPDFQAIKEHYLSVFFSDEGTSLLMTVTSYASIMHFFLVSIRVNSGNVRQHAKKSAIISVSSLALSYFVAYNAMTVFRAPDGTVLQGIGPVAAGKYVATIMVMISFPVVGDVLSELHLLNTELGRLTMSVALVGDVVVTVVVLVNAFVGSVLTFQLGGMDVAKKLAGVFGFVLILFLVFRPWTRRIVQKVPKGGRVSEDQIMLVFVAVLAMSLYSDAFLTSYLDAPVYMGLVLPDGPPLETALMERAQLIHSDLLLPLVFLLGGRWMDVSKVESPKLTFYLFLFGLFVSIVKVIGAMIPAVYSGNISFSNGIFLGLLLCSFGLVQFSAFASLASEVNGPSAIMQECYIALMMCGILVTGLASFLVGKLYDPLNWSRLVGCRTVQHLRRHTEFRIVVPLLHEDPVPVVASFIEASCSNEFTPMCAYVLHLVELKGQLASTLTAHRCKKGQIDPAEMNHLHNVFINLEQAKKGVLVVQPFTATAPLKSMHNDVCSLAIEKNVHLIVVPFPRKGFAWNCDISQAARSLVPAILAQFACSVGILVHHTLNVTALPQPGRFRYNVRVLFWGGKDDREALACAGRMAYHPSVLITVTRFVVGGAGVRVGQLIDDDDEEDIELSRDKDVIEEFKIYNTNNDRVVFDEVPVEDLETTISLIRNVEQSCDLIIVGREQDSRLLLCEGMNKWSDVPELGVVGDMLASSDFADFSFSVLVVQQHQRRS